jgi:hypothetical protein
MERLGEYRVLDASGRIAYRTDAAGPGRIAYRPAAPPPLLRSRPFYPTGYPGARYGPAGAGGPLYPTSDVAGTGPRHGGFFRHLWHAD